MQAFPIPVLTSYCYCSSFPRDFDVFLISVFDNYNSGCILSKFDKFLNFQRVTRWIPEVEEQAHFTRHPGCKGNWDMETGSTSWTSIYRSSGLKSDNSNWYYPCMLALASIETDPSEIFPDILSDYCWIFYKHISFSTLHRYHFDKSHDVWISLSWILVTHWLYNRCPVRRGRSKVLYETMNFIEPHVLAYLAL